MHTVYGLLRVPEFLCLAAPGQGMIAACLSAGPVMTSPAARLQIRRLRHGSPALDGPAGESAHEAGGAEVQVRNMHRSTRFSPVPLRCGSCSSRPAGPQRCTMGIRMGLAWHNIAVGTQLRRSPVSASSSSPPPSPPGHRARAERPRLLAITAGPAAAEAPDMLISGAAQSRQILSKLQQRALPAPADSSHAVHQHRIARHPRRLVQPSLIRGWG